MGRQILFMDSQIQTLDISCIFRRILFDIYFIADFYLASLI